MSGVQSPGVSPFVSCCTCSRPSASGSALWKQFHVHTCPIKISGSDFARWSYSVDHILSAVRHRNWLSYGRKRTAAGATRFNCLDCRGGNDFHLSYRVAAVKITIEYNVSNSLSFQWRAWKAIVWPSNKLQQIRMLSVYKFNGAPLTCYINTLLIIISQNFYA